MTSSSTPESDTINYTYDSNGNLKIKTDARNIALSLGYDSLNRITSKTASDGSLHHEYTYDNANYPDAVGRLVHASNDINAASGISYDPMGCITNETFCVPSICSYSISVNAQYDAAGNMKSLTYPDGRTITQGFDDAGRLSSVNYASWNGNGHSTSYLTSNQAAEYDPPGHLINATMGNGIAVAAAYDGRQHLGLLAYGTSNQLLWGKRYGWTANSNLQMTADILTGVQRQFGYDNLNRLTSAQDVIGSAQGLDTSPFSTASGSSATGGSRRSDSDLDKPG